MKTTLPVNYSNLKIRPKSISEMQVTQAVVPTANITQTWVALKQSQAELSNIQDQINNAKEQFFQIVERIEVLNQKSRKEERFKDQVQSLAALIKYVPSNVVNIGETLIGVVDEAKTTPFVISDKERLDRVMEKFPEVREYVKRLNSSMKKRDAKQTVRRLIEWPLRQTVESK